MPIVLKVLCPLDIVCRIGFTIIVIDSFAVYFNLSVERYLKSRTVTTTVWNKVPIFFFVKTSVVSATMGKQEYYAYEPANKGGRLLPLDHNKR